MSIKKHLKRYLSLQADLKESRKRVKTLNAEQKEVKEQIFAFMKKNRLKKLNAGPLTAKVVESKRMPPLNREFLLSALQAAYQQKIKGSEDILDFIFERRKTDKLVTEALRFQIKGATGNSENLEPGHESSIVKGRMQPITEEESESSGSSGYSGASNPAKDVKPLNLDTL